MSSFADGIRFAGVALALVLAAGCYEQHLCGEAETCNFDDDDCDFRIDEDFVDENGVYATPEHCGGCGVSCAAVFPTAAETACEVIEEDGSFLAQCVLVACPEGWHRAGEGACAPDVPALCLACSEDADCELRQPGARCRETVGTDGETVSLRCLTPCDAEVGGCEPGFECNAEGLCAPETGLCSCTAETLGAELACLFERDASYSCAGVQVCTEEGLGACAPVLGETCNEADDDCDGAVDEDFRDDEGRYVDRLHCGGCAVPCVEPGENMVASCLPDGAGVQCVVECEEGFVDVDGIQANGCECERFDGEGPPPAVGGDADCDGVVDDTDDFVYVATTGSDANPGTLVRPMRTVRAAVARADRENKDVLVSRGIYDGGFEVVAGVSVFGGYRPDFRDRDLALFPVVLENRADPGAPVITCADVGASTRIEGFTVAGSDATQPGRGSTAIFSDGCGSALTFANLEVRAGRGADGVGGSSSSVRYAAVTGGTLEEIDGSDGSSGNEGSAAGVCRRVNAGDGGAQVCRFSALDVSGGDGGDADCPALGCTNGRPCGNAGCTDFTSGGVCDIEAARAVASPNPSAEDGSGPAGGDAGEDTYNAPTNRGVCNFCDDNPTLPRTGLQGDDGGDGLDGAGGGGCGGTPTVDGSGRISGAAGAAGTDGTGGSGGGGGSPGSGYAVIGGTSGSCEDRSGGAGGGGGSGGCGAPGATGGTGGGTSVAVVVRATGSGPTFESVRLVTASGGEGGSGGSGSAGGTGGAGGLGGATRFWCSRTGGRGGDGGRGGAGGGGGGGCGGGSHGFVLLGSPDGDYVTDLGATTVDQVGVAGRGGAGGFSPGAAGSAGTSGTATPVAVF